MYDPDKLSKPIGREGELEDKPPHFTRHRTGQGFSNEKYDYRRLSDHDWGQIKAAYYGMISLVDDNIGRILDAIRAKGIEDDTLVLFTSDHGELLGDHGLLFKGPFLYDCLIKVPMIMKWPGVIPKGARFRQLTEHVDLAPTMLDFAGVRAGTGMQGMSMSAILRGDKGAGRSGAMTEFNCYDWGLSMKTIVTADYKLTYYAGERFGELYDRTADPNEFTNLWDREEYREVKQELVKQLLDRVIETEDTLPLRIGKY